MNAEKKMIVAIVIGLLIGVVLPRFAGMFETLDTELPASTAFLMANQLMVLPVKQDMNKPQQFGKVVYTAYTFIGVFNQIAPQ